MALDTFANFARGTLSAGLAAGATSASLTAGHGARMPAGAANYVIWNITDYADPSDDTDKEVVRGTISSDTLTSITRAQEGTADVNHNTGGKSYGIMATLTAKTLVTDLAATFSPILTGTANQIIKTGTVLSTPQDIHTAAAPTFASLTLTGFTFATTGALTATSETSANATWNKYIASTGSYSHTMAKARGSLVAPRRAKANDLLGQVAGGGFEAIDDSTNATFATASAQFRFMALEDHTSTAHGGSMVVLTAPVGSTTTALRATVDANGITIPASHFLSVRDDAFSTTVANGFRLSQSSAGVGTLQNAATGKIVFDPTLGAAGQLLFHASAEARPIALLEDAVASGGTNRTDTRFSVLGRSGVGPVADFFTGQTNYGAIDAVSAAISYGVISDGSWTNGGGFGSNTQFIIFDEINDNHLISHKQNDITAINFFDDSAGNLKVGGVAARGTTAGTNQIVLFNGTAPAGTLANGVAIYSAGGELLAMDAAGSVANLTLPFTSSVQGIVPASGGSSTQKFLTQAATFVSPIYSKAITVMGPGAAEDLSLFYADDAITITKMVAVLTGSASPSVTWTVRHDTDRNATGTAVVTGGTTTTSTTTGSVVTSFNDATVVADAFVWLETTAQSGTVLSLHLTIFYTVD